MGVDLILYTWLSLLNCNTMNFFKFIIIHEELSSLLGVQTQGLFIEITDNTVLFHIHLV